MVITAISAITCRAHEPTDAPAARRRPNSRSRWMTLCHTTPVSPSATISSRNPASTASTLNGIR